MDFCAEELFTKVAIVFNSNHFYGFIQIVESKIGG